MEGLLLEVDGLRGFLLVEIWSLGVRMEGVLGSSVLLETLIKLFLKCESVQVIICLHQLERDIIYYHLSKYICSV